eukprot:scaffold13424_cov152-Isochrysis_galbana.AAC.1
MPDPDCLLRGGDKWHDRPLVMSGNPPYQALKWVGGALGRAEAAGELALYLALAPAPCCPTPRL